MPAAAIGNIPELTMQYWLIKSEPETYSIDHLERDKTTPWEGVRNYQARNNMRTMKKGDLLLFYHSSCDPAGIAGLASVSREAHADESQFKQGEYFEPKSTRVKPLWECVDVAFKAKARTYLTLESLKRDPVLAGMKLLQRGSRLSVQPVTDREFAHIRKRAGF
jgi:predicted RNA-binding protein with PUA-like domain